MGLFSFRQLVGTTRMDFKNWRQLDAIGHAIIPILMRLTGHILWPSVMVKWARFIKQVLIDIMVVLFVLCMLDKSRGIKHEDSSK